MTYGYAWDKGLHCIAWHTWTRLGLGDNEIFSTMFSYVYDCEYVVRSRISEFMEKLLWKLEAMKNFLNFAKVLLPDSIENVLLQIYKYRQIPDRNYYPVNNHAC